MIRKLVARRSNKITTRLPSEEEVVQLPMIPDIHSTPQLIKTSGVYRRDKLVPIVDPKVELCIALTQ